MSTPALVLVVVLVIVAVVLAVAVALVVSRARRRRAALQERFGPEYDRTLTETDSRRAAERELAARERRVEELQLRPLSSQRCAHWERSWLETKAQFVERPAQAVDAAEAILVTVMAERGYPSGDFERRVADLSVQHPHAVQDYREARQRHLGGDEGNNRTTEGLRQAMLGYHRVLEVLLVDEPAYPDEPVAGSSLAGDWPGPVSR